MKAKQRRDGGFGLTEVIISMLLVMVVFLAFGALLIKALTTVATNGTRATAVQLATDRIEEARVVGSATGVCDVLRNIVEPSDVTQDGRGVELTISGVVEAGSCEQTGATAEAQRTQPRLARVTVSVAADSDAVQNPVAEVTTDIWVSYDP